MNAHPCAEKCVEGICRAPKSMQGCGGCCGCLGPCVVDFQDASAVEQGAPLPDYEPISAFGPERDTQTPSALRIDAAAGGDGAPVGCLPPDPRPAAPQQTQNSQPKRTQR